MTGAIRCLAVVCFLLAVQRGVLAHEIGQDPGIAPDIAMDPEMAIARSQGAIGRELGDYVFRDEDGRTVRLASYRGKPLVIALVFTACTQSCPLIVQRLLAAVEVAQDALGPESFAVVTVGFDVHQDSPARMRAYARSQGVDLPNWRFLSGDHAAVDGLVEDLGFVRFASPRGFDHISQISIVDPDGRVHGHVYGAEFDVPALVEPLKVLALGQATAFTDVAAVIERVKLFCTFFDPKSGRYAVDYSFLISLAVGGVALLGLAYMLVRTVLGLYRPPGDTA